MWCDSFIITQSNNVRDQARSSFFCIMLTMLIFCIFWIVMAPTFSRSDWESVRDSSVDSIDSADKLRTSRMHAWSIERSLTSQLNSAFKIVVVDSVMSQAKTLRAIQSCRDNRYFIEWQPSRQSSASISNADYIFISGFRNFLGLHHSI